MSDFSIVDAGDAALLLQFEARVDPGINARAAAVAEWVRRAAIPHVRDVVIGFCTVTVYFDPLRADRGRLQAALAEATARSPEPLSGAPRGRVIDVPVCYGGAHGPDVADVAAYAGCTADEVIRLHAAETYRVYMLGFVPGFAYMAAVPSAIAAPRRPTPRLTVPAGSLGIAGVQTGIYPIETPGGWHVIGRTPLRVFDADRPAPCLFAPGDTVRFRPIDEAAFHRVSLAPHDPAEAGRDTR